MKKNSKKDFREVLHGISDAYRIFTDEAIKNKVIDHSMVSKLSNDVLNAPRTTINSSVDTE